MDVRNNHLVADINQIPELLRAGYFRVPKRLRTEAERELDGRALAYVNPNTAKNIARWAAKKRAKNRAATKMAKATRKRSRKL